ncbi:MAG: nitroreductase/quinone reductase family protein [Chloroflexota bacterium]
MWFNPIMLFILRSPIHALLSGSTMAITCTGRKSGKALTVPTNYVRDGDKLLVTSFRRRTWWRNLRGGAPVTVRLQGRDYSGAGKAIEDAGAVAENLRAYFRRVPQWAKYSGVTLDANGEPNAESLKRAAQDKVIVEIRLTR